MDMRITYYRCQTCKEQVHCDGCEKLLVKQLSEESEIKNVQVNMTAKTLSLDTTLDADILEEVLEDVGLYCA